MSEAERLAAALDGAMREEYQRGLTDGLAVARKIRDWLTRQPDRQWQRQVREWADREISRAEVARYIEHREKECARPTLTDAEREAIELTVMHLENGGRQPLAATLRGLLERTR